MADEGKKATEGSSNEAAQQQQTQPFPLIDRAEIEAYELATQKFKQISELVKKNALEAKVFTDALKANEKAIRENLKEFMPYNEQLGFYADNLKKSIETTEKLSNAIKNDLQASIEASAKAKAEFLIQIEKLNEVIPKSIESIDGITDSQEKFLKVTAELKEELSEQQELYDALEADIIDLTDALKNKNEISQEELELIIERSAFVEKSNDKEAASLKLRQLIGLQIAANISKTKENIDIEEADAEAKRKQQQELLTLLDLEQKQEQGLLAVNKAMGGVVDKMFFTSASSNLLTQAFFGLTAGAGKLGESITKGLKEEILNLDKAMNRLGNFLMKNMIMSSFEFDNSLASINKNTGGMGKEFEKVAMNTGKVFSASAVSNLAQYGMGVKEAGEAYSALSKRMNNFNNLADDQRKILMVDATIMQNLGISLESYAGVTSTLMGALGKTAEGARNEINRLAADAAGAGRDIGVYVKEFEQLLPKISGFGKEASKIFKEMNAFAAATKGVMSTMDLSNLSGQFDNWDQAAESVSKLNAALGGTSVNIEDMMRADPSERLMMLKRSFDESRKKFDELNIGFKRLLAESFGGDVNKAAAFFNSSLAEAYHTMQKTAAEEEEMEERKKKSASAQEKLNKAIESMKIALVPIIDFVTLIAEGISSVSEKAGGFGSFLMTLGAIAVPVAIAAFKTFSITAKLSMTETIREVTASINQLTAAINNAKNQAAQIPAAAGGGVAGAPAGTQIASPAQLPQAAAPAPSTVNAGPAPQPKPSGKVGGFFKKGLSSFGGGMGSMLGGMVVAGLATAGTQMLVDSIRDPKKYEEEQTKQKFDMHQIISGQSKMDYKENKGDLPQTYFTGVRGVSLMGSDGQEKKSIGFAQGDTISLGAAQGTPVSSVSSPRIGTSGTAVNGAASSVATQTQPVVNVTVKLGNMDFSGMMATLDKSTADRINSDIAIKVKEELQKVSQKGIPS